MLCSSLLHPQNAEEMKRHTKHEGGQQRSENEEERDEQDEMHGAVRNVPSHYTVLKLSVR